MKFKTINRILMKDVVITFLLLAIGKAGFGQSVGVGTSTPDPSAAIEVSSVTQGMLVPRMTSEQRNMIASPATGLLVFDITSNSFWFRNPNTWVELVDSVNTEVHRNGPDKIYMGMNDNVGIGTANPSNKLQVFTADNNFGISHTNGDFDLTTFISDNTGGSLGTTSYYPVNLFTNTGDQNITLLPNGNVGFGTWNPHGSLQLRNIIANRKIVLWESADNDQEYFGFGINGSTLRYQVDNTASNHIFYAGTGPATSAELMRIQGNGNVGIGNSAPNEPLEIHSFANTTNSYLKLSTSGTNQYKAGIKLRHLNDNWGWTLESDDTQDAFLIKRNYNNASGYLTMAMRGINGNVGIGIMPTNQLDIVSGSGRTGTHATALPLYVTGDLGAASSGVEIRHNNGTQGVGIGFNTLYAAGSNPSQDLGLLAKGTTGSLIFSANNAEVMRITSGKVGIGTSSPDLRLSVNNKFGVDNNGSIHLKNLPRQIYFGEDVLASKMILSHSPANPTRGLQYTSDNKFRFLNDSTEVMSVNLQSNSVAIDGNILIGYQAAPSLEVTIPAGGSFTGSCNCPAGTKVVNGGYGVSILGVVIDGSRPIAGLGGWQVFGHNTSSDSGVMIVYATCARLAN